VPQQEMDLPGEGVASQPVPRVAWSSGDAGAKRTQARESHAIERQVAWRPRAMDRRQRSLGDHG